MEQTDYWGALPHDLDEAPGAAGYLFSPQTPVYMQVAAIGPKRQQTNYSTRCICSGMSHPNVVIETILTKHAVLARVKNPNEIVSPTLLFGYDLNLL